MYCCNESVCDEGEPAAYRAIVECLEDPEAAPHDDRIEFRADIEDGPVGIGLSGINRPGRGPIGLFHAGRFEGTDGARLHLDGACLSWKDAPWHR